MFTHLTSFLYILSINDAFSNSYVQLLTIIVKRKPERKQNAKQTFDNLFGSVVVAGNRACIVDI